MMQAEWSSQEENSGGEFSRATTELSLQLLQDAYEAYEDIAQIRELVTDHGSQFFANTRDFQGNTNHAFEQFWSQASSGKW